MIWHKYVCFFNQKLMYMDAKLFTTFFGIQALFEQLSFAKHFVTLDCYSRLWYDLYTNNFVIKTDKHCLNFRKHGFFCFSEITDFHSVFCCMDRIEKLCIASVDFWKFHKISNRLATVTDSCLSVKNRARIFVYYI